MGRRVGARAHGSLHFYDWNYSTLANLNFKANVT